MMYLVCKNQYYINVSTSKLFCFFGFIFYVCWSLQHGSGGSGPSANKIKVSFVILTIGRKLLWINLVPQFNPSDKFITALSLN